MYGAREQLHLNSVSYTMPAQAAIGCTWVCVVRVLSRSSSGGQEQPTYSCSCPAAGGEAPSPGSSMQQQPADPTHLQVMPCAGSACMTWRYDLDVREQPNPWLLHPW
jgi:hypothetical protein